MFSSSAPSSPPPPPSTAGQLRQQRDTFDATSQIKAIGAEFAKNPAAKRLATGVIAGAIIAGFIPGISWLIGAIVGGLIAQKSGRKNR